MDTYRIRELIEFAEQRSRDYTQSNADIAAFRDIAAALRELAQGAPADAKCVSKEAGNVR